MKSFLRITLLGVVASLTNAVDLTYHVRESFSQLSSEVRPSMNLANIAMNSANDPVVHGTMEKKSGENQVLGSGQVHVSEHN